MCWEMKDKELLKEKLKVEVREGKEVWVVSKMKLCRGCGQRTSQQKEEEI